MPTLSKNMRHNRESVGSPKGRTGIDFEYFSCSIRGDCPSAPLFGIGVDETDCSMTPDLHAQHNQSTFQFRGDKVKRLQRADPMPSAPFLLTNEAMLMDQCQDDWDRSLLILGCQVESSMQDDGNGSEVSSTLWDELLMVLSEDEYDQSGGLRQLEVVCSIPTQRRRSMRVSSVSSVAREVSPPHRQTSPNLRSRVPLPEPRKLLRSGKYVS